jgi:phosphonate transport system permease protein
MNFTLFRSGSRSTIALLASAVGGLCVLMWSASGTDLSIQELWKGIPWIIDFARRSFPPNWQYLLKLLKPTVETIQIAIWGTVLAAVIAAPLSLLAAKNTAPNRVVFVMVRQLFNVLRSINELILALVFVVAVGLGPFPGVLALALHGAGMLGRFFADGIEETKATVVEAVRSSGASRIQVVAFGFVPQLAPIWIATIIYRFEQNIRQATVIGMVGAGGIGFEIVSSIKLFEYQNTLACIIVVYLLVSITDAISTAVRRRIIG